MYRNPQPERYPYLELIPQNQEVEAAWLYAKLQSGEIPDRAPNIASPQLRIIAISFRMWAFVHRKFAQKLTLALAYEFGPNATYLEVMAGSGWLAKALYQEGLTGIYIATDSEPPVDPVYPVNKIDAAEAIIKHRDNIDAYVMSWPPADDLTMHYIIEAIPVKSKIIFMGPVSSKYSASEEFFHRTAEVKSSVKDWNQLKKLYFSWPQANDTCLLLEKIQ